MIAEENLKLIDMAVRNIKASGRELIYDRTTSSYKPIYRKGDIVECEFVGIDKEFNYRHFAIVWDVKPNRENINIIPLTSQIKDESIGEFNLGKINGFYTKLSDGSFINKDSFVYVNKMMEVSRKRIYPKYEQRSNGEFIKENSRLKQLNIGNKNIDLIKDSIRMFYLEEGECLYKIIDKKINIMYQLDISKIDNTVLKQGYKLVESYSIYDINDKKVLIFHIDKKRYSLVFKKIGIKERNIHSLKTYKHLYDKDIKWKNNILNVRKDIIKALFSRNDKKVNQSKEILKNFWG